MYTLSQITAGTHIVLRYADGSESSGQVTSLQPEGRNGHDVVLFRTSDGGNSWAYLREVAGIFS
jgi:cell envelope opacity-associated protein A